MSINSWPRRKFLATSLAAPAGTTIRGPHAVAAPSKGVTVQQVIDALPADIPGAPFPNTIDTIKSGDPHQSVKGIVTTMFATDAIIQKTIDPGANFIIAHEPTFYTGSGNISRTSSGVVSSTSGKPANISAMPATRAKRSAW